MIESKIVVLLESPISDVWNIVTNNGDTSWRSDISRVEVLENQFIEYTKNGFQTIFTITKLEFEKQYEFDLVNQNMTGHWIGTFQKVDEHNTRLELTELISVKHKLMKLLAPIYLKKQQKRYIRDLKEKLSEK